MWTFFIRYKKHIFAGHGENGVVITSGKDGSNQIIEVPLGTFKDPDTGLEICEITEDGIEFTLVKGVWEEEVTPILNLLQSNSNNSTWSYA